MSKTESAQFSISSIRVGQEGLRGTFEEFCCQLLRRAPEVPEGSQFRRVRGAGGDGGVEATWFFPDGNVWGLQAKYFSKIGASEKRQLAESLHQAAANYPLLAHYTICLPFNLTAKKGAKIGRPKSGQHETFSKWLDEWRQEFAGKGRTIEIDLWDETELLGRLAQTDTSGGLSRYWFSQEVWSEDWFKQRFVEAKAQAGKRYTPELTIETPLEYALQAFGRSEAWIKKMESLRDLFSEKLDWWRRTANESIQQLSSAPIGLPQDAQALLAAAEPIERDLVLSTDVPELLVSASLRMAVGSSIEMGTVLEA
jgi:hypothetical protein